MKQILSLGLIVALACTSCFRQSSSAKSHNIAKKDIAISETFTAISSESIVDVYYTDGASVAIQVEAPQNCIDKLKIDVVDGTLKINYDAPMFSHDDVDIKVYVTAPDVNSFVASQSSEIEVRVPLSAPTLSAAATGSSEIKFWGINCDNADIAAAGSSNIEFGNVVCKNMTITCAGDAEVKSNSTDCSSLYITTSGSSEVDIKGAHLDMLGCTAAGSSEIEAQGSASQVLLTASGSAEIKTEHLSANTGTATATGSSEIKCSVAQLTQHSSGISKIVNR